MNEHERGFRSGYDAAIHDAAIDGSTAREMLIAGGVIIPLPAERLEYLRSQLDAECISYGELAVDFGLTGEAKVTARDMLGHGPDMR